VLIACSGVAGVAVLAAIASRGEAQGRSGPTDLATERQKYEEEVAAALQPVQKRYITRLTTLQKLLARKGDKAGATAVETELERMGAAMAQQMRYPIEGQWVVKYQSGAIRTYVIHADGSVEFVEEKQRGRFTKNGDDVLVDFGDNKIERFYWNTVLVVEHYNPKSEYGTAPPKLTGFAEKAQ
jgi:hypothetical protein